MKRIVVGIFSVCALIFIIVFYHDVIFDLERQDVKTVECFGISFEIPTEMEEFYEDDEYAFFSIKDKVTAKDDLIFAVSYIENISIEEQVEAYEFVQAQDSEANQFSVSDFELLDTDAKRIEFDKLLENENWHNIMILLPINADLIELTFSFKTKQPLYEEIANDVLSSMTWRK